jgi:hypothetical protein
MGGRAYRDSVDAPAPSSAAPDTRRRRRAHLAVVASVAVFLFIGLMLNTTPVRFALLEVVAAYGAGVAGALWLQSRRRVFLTVTSIASRCI